METNFEIYKNYAIEYEGSIYDLHNNFRFSGFDYNVTDQHLTLRWKVRHDEWVPIGQPSEIILSVEEVSYLKLLPRSAEMPFTEDDCLSY